MHEMLAAVAGDAEKLREKPMAIFDCCPSPPLKWSDLTAQALIDCARTGIVAELISMPLTGATSPVTLAGAVTQHCAESPERRRHSPARDAGRADNLRRVARVLRHAQGHDPDGRRSRR